jgi:hypothetical protein
MSGLNLPSSSKSQLDGKSSKIVQNGEPFLFSISWKFRRFLNQPTTGGSKGNRIFGLGNSEDELMLAGLCDLSSIDHGEFGAG